MLKGMLRVAIVAAGTGAAAAGFVWLLADDTNNRANPGEMRAAFSLGAAATAVPMITNEVVRHILG